VLSRLRQAFAPDREEVLVFSQTPFSCVTPGKVEDLSRADSEVRVHRNESNEIVAVSTGLLYNQQLLRERLQSKGHTMSTADSMEPIVHLYEDYGLQSLAMIDGPFAFVLWDGRRKRLLLANDHLGQRSLYFIDSGREIYFASVLEPLRYLAGYGNEVDTAALYHYLTYYYVLAPYTLLKDIAKVPPGHFITIEPDKGITAVVRYWVPRFGKRVMSLDEAVRGFEETLDGIVDEMVGARSEVGVLFSGGIDSSCLVASLQRLGIKTRGYSFGSGLDGASDEYLLQHGGSGNTIRPRKCLQVALSHPLLWRALFSI
jgi:asparagine synthetase B (glutamine-hydrolysing)